MARSKTTSQNIAILVAEAQGTGGYTGPYFPEAIAGINSCDFSINVVREDAPEYGQYLPSKIPTTSPTVDLNFSFYSLNFINEGFIGLNVEQPEQHCLKYIADGTRDQRNYFMFIAPEGADAYTSTGADEGVAILGIGNCYLSSYSVSASIGGFPETSVAVQGMNVRSYTGGIMQPTPEINPATNEEHAGYFEIGSFDPGPFVTNVIRPGDIEVDLSSVGDLFYSYSGASVQSFNLSFDLQRRDTSILGQKYPSRRDIILPVDVRFQTVIRAKDIEDAHSLQTYLCGTGLYNANLRFKRASCAGDGEEVFGYSIKGMRLDTQSSSFGSPSDPQVITTSWTAQIGGTGNLSRGLFMSGNTSIV